MVTQFIVHAPTSRLTRLITEKANQDQEKAAEEWAGGRLRRFTLPCVINVTINERTWGWFHNFDGVMSIDLVGKEEEILTRMLPHEVGHTVLARHFGNRPPRWLDEGVAISCESDAPTRLNGECGTTNLDDFFQTRDYPGEWRPFYGQSYSVTSFLRARYGMTKVYQFARFGNHLGYEWASLKILRTNLEELDYEWRAWKKSHPMGGYRRQCA